MKVKLLSHFPLFATPWTVACQVPPPTGFSRQEYWSGFPFPSPEDLPDPGTERWSPAPQTDSLPSEPPGKLIYIMIRELLFLKPVNKTFHIFHFKISYKELFKKIYANLK